MAQASGVLDHLGVAGLAALLLPGRCAACGLVAAGPLCDDCLASCRAPPGPVCPRCGSAWSPLGCGRCRRFGRPFAFEQAHAHWEFRGAARLLIHRFKYGGRRDVLGPLGARLGRDGRLAPALEGRPRPLVIPIPMRRASRRERGYDQALELARGLAHSRGLALAPGALRRRRQPLRAQVGAPGHQRLRQLRGSFRAGSRVGGERVLLVDDVMSSGATVDAAARALRCAGALRVDVIVLAT